MAHQEMTYTPSYYQEQDRFVAIHHYDASISSPPAVHLPLKQQQLALHEVYGAYRNPASQASSPEAPSFLSESSTASYSVPKAFAEPVHPTLEDPTVPAMAFVLSPRTEEGSISNFTSSSSGNARKENRSRTSWTDQLSYVSGENHRHSGPRTHSRISVYGGIQEEPVKSDEGQNALLMLLHLSTSVPLFSMCAGIYTIFSLLFVIFFSPLRLCPPTPFYRSTSFSMQLCQLLAPVLCFHERFLPSNKRSHRRRSPQSSPSRRKDNDPYRSAPLSLPDSYSVANLIFVLLLSPFLSLGLALAAWTAAFFWGFAMIVGNPDGTERKDDGRAAVLGVGNWWRKWLGKARRTS